jgi:hypothetical protein
MYSQEQTAALVNILAHLLSRSHPYLTGELYDRVGCWIVTAGKDWYGMIVQNVTEHLGDFAAFCYQNRVNMGRYSALPQAMRFGEAIRFATAAGHALGGRRLFWTAKGYLGIGPATIQCNDNVCILSGGAVPFILRRMPRTKLSSRKFLLIGEAYVHGIMHGTTCLDENNQRSTRKFNVV